MSERYGHRNGETEPPTEAGYFWVRGSLSCLETPWWIEAIQGVVFVTDPETSLGRGELWIGYAAKGLDDMADPKNVLCRWWGPVQAPWESVAALDGEKGTQGVPGDGRTS